MHFFDVGEHKYFTLAPRLELLVESKRLHDVDLFRFEAMLLVNVNRFVHLLVTRTPISFDDLLLTLLNFCIQKVTEGSQGVLARHPRWVL